MDKLRWRQNGRTIINTFLNLTIKKKSDGQEPKVEKNYFGFEKKYFEVGRRVWRSHDSIAKIVQ